MSYRSRIYRQRNTQQNEQEQNKGQDKFFNRSSENSEQTNANAFFQAKSNDATGEKDPLEKQANQNAAALSTPEAVKDKKEETIQRLSTPEEDKQTSTNDERIKKDKENQS